MSKSVKLVIEDQVSCYFVGLRKEDLDVLWDKFGIFVDGHFHMPAFQLRRWDGKIRFFDKNGRTYVKLLDEILPYLDSWGYEIQFVDQRVAPVQVEARAHELLFGDDHEFKLRPYQVEVVNGLLDEGSGFAICGTGAGKTSMCAALALLLFTAGLQTIVIVPSSDLVTQTAEAFRQMLDGFEEFLQVGEYSGDSKDINCHVVVATWQSLQNAPHYMSYFGAVIVDEAHGAKAEVIKTLINTHGKHISYRYGVTGTLPKPKTDQYSLKCSIGRVVKEVPAAWLIANGYLSTVEIEPVETQDDDPDLPDYAAEKDYLAKQEDRLDKIAVDVIEQRDKFGNTMVLVNSITQGQLLQEKIPGSVFLYGGTGKKDRREQYSQYADRDDLIVIATFGIASTGISIDRIFCLYLVDAAKSFIRCIQSIGRGLRKSGDKNHVHVVDLHSKLKHSRKHFRDRKKYYAEASYPLAEVRKLGKATPKKRQPKHNPTQLEY